MKAAKEELQRYFSERYKEFYEVELFRREGFLRKRCPSCGRHFWTLDPQRRTCPDQPCERYGFIGKPPTPRRLGYVEAWREIEAFFKGHGHASVARYPVVARWRPDLYFTVASIVSFQRVEDSRVIFEFPANPLIIPQVCVRFKDLGNVGLSGKHYTTFCMIGQHSITGEGVDGGYWKDTCIDLDFELLTRRLGIPKEEVVFKEDVWLGYGAFGYSLEYFVRGLELGNAVFTEFEGTPESYRRTKQKVIDMGAGLERFAWLLNGTPMSYESVFPGALRGIIEATGLAYDGRLLSSFAIEAGLEDWEAEVQPLALLRRVAGRLGVEERSLASQILPLQAAYAIADHARTLLFAIADGLIPSNMAGGYNLRLVLRRALSLMRRYGWALDIKQVCLWHAEELKAMYPELLERIDDVFAVLEAEQEKYARTLSRVDELLARLGREGGQLSVDRLVTLYESHGVSPELLQERGLLQEVPAAFYSRLSERAQERREERPRALEQGLEGLPPTRPLYYEDASLARFSSRVLRVLPGPWVVLEATAFYPEGGGQVADTGTLGGIQVVDVQKLGDVVLHKLASPPSFSEGEMVEGLVDIARRRRIMAHHTATHILNAAARRALGGWVWQHSALKTPDYARLDITHFRRLEEEELRRIEEEANRMVRQNLAVTIEYLPRPEAEARYSFRIYQGGAYPGRVLRIVKVGDYDVEACGGTHCSSTGEIGLIKVVRSERVQDGVERLVYVAGEAALEYVRAQEAFVREVVRALGTSHEKALDTLRALLERAEAREKGIRQALRELARVVAGGGAESLAGLYYFSWEAPPLPAEAYGAFIEEAIRANPRLVCVIAHQEGAGLRLLAGVGEEARRRGLSAKGLLLAVAKRYGGGAGGDDRFAQGGVPGARAGEVLQGLRESVKSGARQL